MRVNACCFFGHRKIRETEELKNRIFEIIENLIVNEKINTFLFGSKSRFDKLCLEIVTDIKEKHPHIKRIYVRAEYPYINDDYKNYLLEFYDDTYYSEKLFNSGRASYVKRNYEMIDNSEYCVVYYSDEEAPKNRKSGTQIAYHYAVKKEKKIINVAKRVVGDVNPYEIST